MNLINIDLTALNAENLKKLAKEAKVSGWWTMKKAELLEALTLLQEEQKEEEHLTDLDKEEAIEKAAKELGISKSHAYKVIHKLNAELRDKGYLTISGRVNRNFFMEKFCYGKTEKEG